MQTSINLMHQRNKHTAIIRMLSFDFYFCSSFVYFDSVARDEHKYMTNTNVFKIKIQNIACKNLIKISGGPLSCQFWRLAFQ